jgi:transcription initiation factor TFIIH subunit 2
LIENASKAFTKEYFDQNPICQMGLIIGRNGIAEKISDFTGNAKKILKCIEDLPKFSGDASLQNCLEVALDSFQTAPLYATKEILILYSSLSSIDPSDIFETIKKLKKANVRCSIVGLGSEIYVAKYLSKETNGSYSIPLTEENYKELILQHSIPPPSKKDSEIVRILFSFILESLFDLDGISTKKTRFPSSNVFLSQGNNIGRLFMS